MCLQLLLMTVLRPQHCNPLVRAMSHCQLLMTLALLPSSLSPLVRHGTLRHCAVCLSCMCMCVCCSGAASACGRGRSPSSRGGTRARAVTTPCTTRAPNSQCCSQCYPCDSCARDATEGSARAGSHTATPCQPRHRPRRRSTSSLPRPCPWRCRACCQSAASTAEARSATPCDCGRLCASPRAATYSAPWPHQLPRRHPKRQ